MIQCILTDNPNIGHIPSLMIANIYGDSTRNITYFNFVAIQFLVSTESRFHLMTSTGWTVGLLKANIRSVACWKKIRKCHVLSKKTSACPYILRFRNVKLEQNWIQSLQEGSHVPFKCKQMHLKDSSMKFKGSSSVEKYQQHKERSSELFLQRLPLPTLKVTNIFRLTSFSSKNSEIVKFIMDVTWWQPQLT